MLQSKMVYYTEAITVKILCLKYKLFSLVIPAALKSSIKKISFYVQFWFKVCKNHMHHVTLAKNIIILRQINLNQKGFNPHLQV